MKRSAYLLGLVPGILMLVGCGAAPVQVDREALAGIRTIAIIEAPEPAQYTVINKGSPLAGAGAIGGAFMAMSARKDEKGLLGAMARTQFSLRDQLMRDLQATLRARGYQTRVVNVQREKPGALLDDYANLPVEGAEGILDVVIANAGYATQHWMTSSHWRPEARVFVGLYSRPSAKVVYRETFMYGYHNPLMSGTNVDAPETYRFADKAAMEASDDPTLVGGLKDASKSIAGRIADQLTR